MVRLRMTPGLLNGDTLEPAVAALRADGIVAFPTETYYGLAADPRSEAAVRRLFAVKQRPADHALPLIAANTRQVTASVGTMTPLAERLASRGWPGPLTLVIPASPHLCAEVHLSTGRIAVRVPADAVARALAEAAGHAITSTSANLTGRPPASTADEVASAFGDAVDVLIDVGPTPGGLPSTIVDATGTEPILLRAGAVPWERVLEFLH